ncbi:MAG: hypothetical protein K2J83_00650 [Clostridia bacterium]|nr:hypothetical protein [Clostridia bacterium]
MANKTNGNQVLVERETYEKDGNTYFSHVVKGKIRGKDVKATVVPHDVGGYAILDIVFGEKPTAELVLKPYEIKDEKTKRTVKGNTYAVRSADEATGEIYECPVKPFRNSDKTILTMLIG